ncbi:MAG: tryptophan synthase subunit alpha [Clostridiaceae bacterium]|jgi:tryptophan synthase alpha chain|nr:tryptophan synthase subunit alpha [Clostridiaceae bacterium]
MGRIDDVFKNKKAFIPFITAGDPSLEITEQLIHAMTESGADLIELGIPFSDPVAEGPVIEKASLRALSAGVNTDKIFDMVERVREKNQIPMAFMSYANPIYSYGTERFMANCRKVGIDAIIVPDIPFEEKEELKPFCDQYGIVLISMIAPTSKERILKIVKEAEGFLYCVSSMGTTGVRNEIGSHIDEMISLVKQVKGIPCAVGFGVSSPAQAKALASLSDGVIVGSAIVKLIAEYKEDCIPHVKAYVRDMSRAII